MCQQQPECHPHTSTQQHSLQQHMETWCFEGDRERKKTFDGAKDRRRRKCLLGVLPGTSDRRGDWGSKLATSRSRIVSIFRIPSRWKGLINGPSPGVRREEICALHIHLRLAQTNNWFGCFFLFALLDAWRCQIGRSRLTNDWWSLRWRCDCLQVELWRSHRPVHC